MNLNHCSIPETNTILYINYFFFFSFLLFYFIFLTKNFIEEKKWSFPSLIKEQQQKCIAGWNTDFHLYTHTLCRSASSGFLFPCAHDSH